MARKAADMTAKLKTVPERPGIYMFRDGRERILYVGKAGNLRKRIRSYFQKSAKPDPRKEAMLRRTRDFTFVVTDSETEALALEANLIKEHKPRYNILLRDDKNYPYLKLTVNEEWPKVELVRGIERDGSVYFGPCIPASSARETISFIRRNFGIRTCRYRLDRPMRPCVQYQMGRCPAPCAGLVSRDEYMKAVKEAERFLRGEKKELTEELTTRMQRLSEELRFEEAARVRDRLQALKGAFASQKVVAPDMGDIDVIGFCREGVDALFQVFFVRKGILISTKDFLLRDTEFIPDEELSGRFIELFYSKEMILPDEIAVQVLPEGVDALREWLTGRRGKGVKITLPKRGKKKELVHMASGNARVLLHAAKGAASGELLEKLRERLGLEKVPASVGAFDVSTMFGSHSVGAFVWWEDGGFRKELYRHLRIRDVEGMDDYSMMREIIGRTVGNLGSNLPDLVLIDGGMAHLDAALDSLARAAGEGALEETAVVAVAKGPDRAFLQDGRVLPLDDGAPETLLLRRIRDEAHRFAVGFHRRLRNKGLFESGLERIRGIGKKRRLALLKRFGSIEAVRKASLEEIARVEGMNRKTAETLLRELRDEER